MKQFLASDLAFWISITLFLVSAGMGIAGMAIQLKVWK